MQKYVRLLLPSTAKKTASSLLECNKGANL